MNIKDSYGLKEISEWAKDSEVKLPTVQRGFVWKPHQIEKLWDSLLRGFPVGAFVIAHNKLSNTPSLLLDGQQRATAICLGFETETFKKSQDKIKIFIDLEGPKQGDTRKYIFRVITRSHPWGYKRNDNTKPLDSESIRMAMKLYGIEDHLDADSLDPFFPFDAVLPVPLKFFLCSTSATEVINSIKAWQHWKTIVRQYINKNIAQELNYFDIEKKMIAQTEKYYMEFNELIINERIITALPLNFEKATSYNQESRDFKENMHNEISENDTKDEDESSSLTDDLTDEIENLFIRLNAGGTPLRGEELNYSILKAHIDDDTLLNKIETSCEGLFKAARFITIVFRLFHIKSGRDVPSMRVKPEQFQKFLIQNKAEKNNSFIKYLTEIVTDKLANRKTLLEYINFILNYECSTNSCGLPHLVSSKISAEAPELMFVLLYRIKIMGDRFDINTDTHLRMLGTLSLLYWFGKSEKQKDHSKLLSNIWPSVAGLRCKDHFWSASTIQRAKLDKDFITIPSKTHIIEIKEKMKKVPPRIADVWSYFDKNCNLGNSAKRIFNNRNLVIYAQRQPLSEWFRKESYNLDDTNVPFDWDHISPNNHIKKKQKINPIIKKMYNTNGNLRAWPYSLNRIDQDDVPSLKLSPSCRDNWSTKEDEYYRIINKYSKTTISNNKDLSNKLLGWSCCNSDWLKCNVTNFKPKKNWLQVFRYILDRNISIYFDWYDNLRIYSLMPTDSNIGISQFIYKTKWNVKRTILENIIECDFKTCNYFVTSYNIEGVLIYAYIAYPENKIDILREGSIEFGIFEISTNSNLSKIRIQEEDENKYIHEENLLRGYLTLISDDNYSYVELFFQIKKWLENIPDKKFKRTSKLLSTHFVESLKVKF